MDGIRVDKWLWAARFFKHRKLATEAVSGGHVHLNGQRVKPARALRVGDRLTITKGALAYEIEVVGLSEQRGPASAAVKLYLESPTSVTKRALYAEQARLMVASSPHPEKRPDKRQRRHIIRFKQ